MAKRLHIEAVQFAIVGIVNTALDFATFFILVGYFDIHIIPANVCGFCVGVINSFFMNKYWSFRHRQGALPTHFQLPLYILLGIGGMVLSTVTVWFLAKEIPLLAAKIVATGVSFVWNFFGSRYLIYRAE